MQIDIPGYRIIRTLGKGGMASVYLAIQESFEREVALKIMSPELSNDSSFGDRFLREARIVSRLIHPNIVTVYDVGIHAGYYFLSMEYVPGKELTEHRFELTLTESLSVIKDIAHALDFAGKKGYVHRDVKPENIMLHEDGGRAVLMDFGIARPSDVASGMTQTGMAIGTPHYMSPEQAKGMAVDSRADLYSLGVVLFLLLTGRVPYHADSAVVVGIMHVSEDIPRLPPYAHIFQEIIDRVLAKDPAERYQSGAELVHDLDAIAADEIAAATENRELALALIKAEKAVPCESPVDPNSPTDISEDDPAFCNSDIAQTIVTNRPLVQQPDAVILAASTNDKVDADITLEALAASAEDRVGQFAQPSTQKHSKLGLGLVVFMLALVGCGFYFQATLKNGLSEYFPALQATQSIAEQAITTSSRAVDSQLQNSEITTGISSTKQTLVTDAELEQAPSSPEEILEATQDSAGQELLNQELLGEVITEPQTTGQSSTEQASTEQAATEQAITEPLNSEELSSEELSPERELSAKTITEQQQAQLQQAEIYLAANALTSPAGANAFEIYQALLQENPDNDSAQQGVLAIAQRYSELAEAQQKKLNIDQALKLVTQGLALNAEHPKLLEQQQTLIALQAQQREQEAANSVVLLKAQEQQAKGQLISPRGDNALEGYRSILAKNPRHGAARNAEAAIEQALIDKVKQLIEAEEFTEAGTQLASAREYFPQSQQLLALSLELDHAINEQVPKVVRLAVTSQAVDYLAAQEPAIITDRSIYIGFEYRNFSAETSVIQAILYEGSRSHQIVQVPVILTGKQGTQFFRMEQPVTGFAEGGYSIDLLFNSQLLITAKFSVKKS